MNSYGESDHYSGKQGQAYFAWQNALAHLGAKLNARKFEKYVKRDDSVLDFGCGGGWLLKELQCGSRIGVEVNIEAHASCLNNGVEVHSSTSTVRTCPLDVIISHHCLEHVPYPIEALKSLKRLLKPDGRLVVVVPIDDWRLQKKWNSADINHHLHTWTPLLFANTLHEAGFTVQEIRILTHAWFPGWEKIYPKVPRLVFDTLCYLFGVLRMRRQVIAIAAPRLGQ